MSAITPAPTPGCDQLPLFVLDVQPEPVEPEPRPVRDVELDATPERYHALLVRFERVDPECARVARIAIAQGEEAGRPYDLDFLGVLVERAERKTPADPADRRPVEARPYRADRLRALVEGSFRSVPGVWEALAEREPGVIDTTLDLIARLRARLAGWGLHTDDVSVTTAGPEGERPPHEYTEAQTCLAAATCRLAKDLADEQAGRYRDDTPRRLARDWQAFEEHVEAARRLLDGGPLRLPVAAVETVGDRSTWWAIIGGPGKSKRKRFSIKRGRRARAFAERDGVLGPFRTKRQAQEAAERATCIPEDSRIGLFGSLPAREPARQGVPIFQTTH